MAMCLENLTLPRDAVVGVNFRPACLRSNGVGLGLLQGLSELPRPPKLGDWGLRSPEKEAG